MPDVPKPGRTISRSLIREELRDRLIADIRGGQLPPGTRLVEASLARQFGVSQAPVREALRDLAQLGFVVSAPYRGTSVRRLSNRDLAEMYLVRAALEGLAAREAATRLDAALLADLEGQIASMRDAAARNDQRAHVAADFAFHQTVVKASGNRMLEQIWETLRLATTTGVTHAMTQETHRSMQEIGERHVPVLAALRTRDPRKAEAAMRAHIEEPGQWIVNALDREDRQPTERNREAAG